jgi:GWxTD domain-containing protein
MVRIRLGAAAAGALVYLLCAATLEAQTAVELFQKAKGQVKAQSYEDALKTLDALDTLGSSPGHEAERKQLEAPLAFYRGVCAAALGRKDDAHAQFQRYLALVPNASMDASIYPKKAVAAFEEARKSASSSEPPSEIASIGQAYAKFRLTTPPPPETPGETWGDGPVKFLFTADEKRDWPRMTDPVSRSEFVTKFWASRDPRPETPENEFKDEFQRRVAYADANLVQGELRGSLTDRGMVFVLVGPPTYVGRKPLSTGDDTADAAGMSTAGSHDAQTNLAAAGKTSGGKASAIVDRSSGTRITDSAANWREVWHYRRELLPAGVPYLQVDFDFITRKGYGENVLQRDPSVLNALDAAKKQRKKS